VKTHSLYKLDEEEEEYDVDSQIKKLEEAKMDVKFNLGEFSFKNTKLV